MIRAQSAFYNIPNRISINNFPNETKTNYFIQDKKNTDQYYKKARVGSARKIIVRNGIPKAICYDIRNNRGQKLNHYKYTMTKKKKIKQFIKKIIVLHIFQCMLEWIKNLYYHMIQIVLEVD